MGLTLPENFRQPYLSATIGEFWERWHISLSHWLQEYVFEPLVWTGWTSRLPVVGRFYQTSGQCQSVDHLPGQRLVARRSLELCGMGSFERRLSGGQRPDPPLAQKTLETAGRQAKKPLASCVPGGIRFCVHLHRICLFLRRQLWRSRQFPGIPGVPVH